jgi:TPR repeat protein
MWTRVTLVLLVVGFLWAVPESVADAKQADGAQFHVAMADLRARNFTGALEVFESLSGAGHDGAAFMLGVMYEHGLGVTPDEARAAAWYLKAAQRGSASAQYNIAVFHQLGRSVERSDAEALKWHRAAAAQGHRKAQNNLGALYFAGAGVTRDLVEAWKWLTLASKGLKGDDLDAALRNRDKLKAEMSAAQIQDAEGRVSAWRPGT